MRYWGRANDIVCPLFCFSCLPFHTAFQVEFFLLKFIVIFDHQLGWGCQSKRRGERRHSGRELPTHPMTTIDMWWGGGEGIRINKLEGLLGLPEGVGSGGTLSAFVVLVSSVTMSNIHPQWHCDGVHTTESQCEAIVLVICM